MFDVSTISVMELENKICKIKSIPPENCSWDVLVYKKKIRRTLVQFQKKWLRGGGEHILPVEDEEEVR